MANELIVTNAAALAALVDKTTGDTLTAAEYTTLKDSLQEANAATRTANTVFAGPTTGAAAAPTFRALVAADIPSLSAVYQPLDATLTALAALGAGPGFLQVTGADTFSIAALSGAQVNTALGYTAANAASLNSSALTGNLPALNGSALTALNATNLGSGTIPDGRFPSVLPAVSGANLTNLPGGVSGLTAGVIPVATSATAIANSKWTMSGTNLGTATLYDDTAVTGVTSLTLRPGAAQSTTNLLSFLSAAGSERAGFWWVDETNRQMAFGSSGNVDGQFFAAGYNLTGGAARLDIGTGLVLGNTLDAYFGADSAIIFEGVAGFEKSAPGIVKVTDGSTGFGSIRAANLGVETANGAIANVKSISESITLDTGALFTDSAADLLPANSVIRSVVARITTTITTSTDWALGDATTTARFAAANATLTAGTTTVGLAHQQGSVSTDAAGPVQTAAAKLRITLTGANPGAGVVRVTVFYEEFTAPTS